MTEAFKIMTEMLIELTEMTSFVAVGDTKGADIWSINAMSGYHWLLY